MKTGSVTKNNAFKTSDPTMVCGVIIESNGGNPGGNVQAGTTTRYWDCCKPSCSWPGKVSGSNTQVKTCTWGGYHVMYNPNAVSGCNGGHAFTCNNQQPWSVNSTFSYGYAAAHIAVSRK